MKIVFNLICSPHGGIANYVKGILEAFKKYGFKSGIFYNKNISNKSFKNSINELLSNDLIFDNIKTHKTPKLKTFFDLIYIMKKLKKYNRDQIIIYAHGTSSVGISLILKIIKPNIKVFYFPHGGLSHFYNRSFLKKYSVYSFDFILRLLKINFAYESIYTKNIYQNNSCKFLKKNYEDYIYSIPSKLKICFKGQYPKFKTTKSSKNSEYFIVIYMGTWRKIKGAYKLLNVLKELNDKDLILDDGRKILFKFYTDLINIRDLKINSFIKFYNWTENPFEIINQADLQIIPSQLESFGYVGLEAIANQTPVIHTNIGGLKEIFANTNMPILPIDFNKNELLNLIKYVSHKEFYELLGMKFNFNKFLKNSFWNYDKLNNFF